LIDWFIIVVALIPVLLVFGFVGDPLGAVARLRPILESSVGAVLGTLYFAACEASPWRGTPGKKLLALTVQGSAGERIGILRSIWRKVCKQLSGLLFPVAFCLVAFSHERRCLHDYLAGTWVSRPRR
jgi:uncharacterized RDD family membrane protein YckC